MPSIPFTFSKVAVKGTAEGQCVRAEYDLQLEVFEESYLFVPIMPQSAAVVSLVIDGPGGRNVGDAHLVVRHADSWGMSHTLLCNAKGCYNVRIEVLIPYSNTTVKQAVVLPCVEAVDTFCNFQVPGQDVALSVSKVIWSKARSPSADMQEGDDPESSYLQARMPPTTSMSIKWTANRIAVVNTPSTASGVFVESPLEEIKKREEEARLAALKKEDKKEMVVTSNQDVLFSIGGGVCHVQLTQNLHITNGSLSMMRILIPAAHGSRALSEPAKGWLNHLNPEKKLKILSCDGATVRSWDCCGSEDVVLDEEAGPKKSASKKTIAGGILSVGAPEASSSSSAPAPAAPALAPGLVINVFFDSAVEGHVHFALTAELDLDDTSCRLCLPTFVPLQVNRSKGAVGIQAKSSVEIREGDTRAVTKVDIAELPESLTRSKNVLLAYKYLTSNHRLCFEAVKHDDVDVIVALCESATYKLTHTGDQLLYDLSFNVKNTQCQYLKVLLPPRSSVWTASVGGNVVKPALDQTGKTLLPLAKGSDVAFTAKLVFIAPAPKLPAVRKEVKKFSVTFPTIDLPVTHLRAELFLPETHIYSAFEGGIEEVEHFNTAQVLRQVHDANNYTLAANKKSAGLGFGSRSRARRSYERQDSLVMTNCMPPPPQMMQQQQMQPQMQQQQMQPWMQQQQQAPMQIQAQMRGHASRNDSMSCSSLDDSDEDDEEFYAPDLVEEMEEEQKEGAMAMGIKPLEVSTDSLQTGKYVPRHTHTPALA